jgi:hypothetical protein
MTATAIKRAWPFLSVQTRGQIHRELFNEMPSGQAGDWMAVLRLARHGGSNCCGAPVNVVGSDEGTQLYQCQACDQACDVELIGDNAASEVPARVERSEKERNDG